MAEYLIQDTTLTNIAAPIKTLMGLTDNLTTDEMVSNLNDANTAVANALVALTEKEVVVPNGSNVTDLADLIARIEAGGAKIITGEFTLDTAAGGIPIEHNLGEVPNFAYYFALLAPATSNQYGNKPTRFFAIYLDGIHYSYYVSGGMSNKSVRYAVKAYDISNVVKSSDADGIIYAGNSATNSTIIIGGRPSSSYGYFKNAITYKWGVGVI